MTDHENAGTNSMGGVTGVLDGIVSSDGTTRKNGILSKLFSSCAPDPRGSVHRAWGISLLFIVLYFALSIFEMVSLQQSGDGSMALIIASIWTGLIHLALGVLGTFVLKRFPTSFSVGFFLGVLVVLANQNIILYASFHKYTQGSTRSNQVFAGLGFVLFAVLTFMSLLLVHFKQEVVVSPLDGVSGDDNDEIEDTTGKNNAAPQNSQA